MNYGAVSLAFLSAALFFGAADPAVLAGHLYCGAGLGGALLRRLRQ